jgi:hypothetical protein
MKPYDYFKISPDVYDMRKDMEGKDRPGAGGAESPRKKKVDEGDNEKKKKRGEEDEEPEDPLGGKIGEVAPGEQVHQ